MSDEWTLVTVTNGGEVNSSRHASKYEAEQAKCMAIYGMTLEQRAARLEQERLWEEERRARFLKEHPPRVPTDAERKEYADTSGITVGGCGTYWTLEDDGLLHAHEDGMRITTGYVDPHEIKWIECFPSRPGEA